MVLKEFFFSFYNAGRVLLYICRVFSRLPAAAESLPFVLVAS